MLSNKIFLKNVRFYREEMGLTQKQVAKGVGCSLSIYRRVEAGDEAPNPHLIKSLAEFFDVNVSRHITGVNDYEDEPLCYLSPVNFAAPESIIYHGIAAVLDGLGTYWSDFEEADYDTRVSENSVDSWSDTNRFMTLYNVVTNSFVGIRDYGKYCPAAEDFLFCSPYIPIRLSQPVGQKELRKKAIETKDQLDKLCSVLRDSFEKPIFILRHLDSNTYLGWSLRENKHVYVYNYKSFRGTSGLMVGEDLNDVREDSDYGIIPPSDALIHDLGLTLYPAIWSRLTKWDKWEKVPSKRPRSGIPATYQAVYVNSLALINKGRAYNYGEEYLEMFVTLENSVARFENFCKIGAPKKVLADEITLMMAAAKRVESAIS